MRIKITNGMLICPTVQSPKVSNILIDAGKFIDECNASDFKADITIDAKNKWILPSLVDLKGCVHLPGASIQYDNGIKELTAYEKTGFSHALCFPNQSHCFDKSTTIHKLIHSPNPITLMPVGALTVGNLGEQLNDYQTLQQAGCMAFSSGLKSIQNLIILRSAYELLASFGLLVIICPQESTLSHNGCAHEGKIATRLGLKPIPRMAETVSLVQHLSLIEATGVKAHFTGLTSYESIEIIHHYKNKGLNITCDVAIANLHLTDLDIGEFNSLYHVNPPLRSTEDLLGLKKGLVDGTIDAITSHHCALTPLHKLAPFEETVPGMSIIDSFLKLCLKSHQDLSSAHTISLNQWIAKFTFNPLKILGLSGGTLQSGQPANLIIVDPKHEHILDQSTFYANFKQSPFDQWPFSHEISQIIFNGQVLN